MKYRVYILGQIVLGVVRDYSFYNYKNMVIKERQDYYLQKKY